MTNEATHGASTLVVGGGGKTGRRVADRLRASGHAVRLASRSTTPRFDWTDRSTWAAALNGAQQAYVAYQPDLAVPGALDTVTGFFEQAVRLGVKRLVLLSGRGEIEAEQAEQALQASGADWTILRCSWFSQNFSETYLRDAILSGEVALPVGDVPEPFVDVDDIADVAVAALTRPGHIGRLYELTGPRALSFRDAVAQIAAVTDCAIRFERITPQDFGAGMAAAQVPQVEIDLVLYLLQTVLDGRNQQPTDGVQRALGRAPRDFSDYVRRAAAEGAWRVE
jgi:uncharacterized protein YbjT (DUF2867 family)